MMLDSSLKIKIIILALTFMAFKNFYSQEKPFPHWAKGIVWYQIFPERFANGDFNNEPKAEKVFINRNKIPEGWEISKWTSNWFSQSDWEKKLGGNFNEHLTKRRYGGDIQGIINNLDYLKNLGIDAIYLNPIFEAVSMHKYDGSTFHHIDINFGPNPKEDLKLIESEIPDDPKTWKWTSADKKFLELINEVHKRGMHIIIDGVFNHTGIMFWAFQDIVNKGKDSKYFNWYQIHSIEKNKNGKYKFDYKGWWNIKDLPEFNRTKNDLHPEVKNYIFNSTKRWMDPNNDGNTNDGIDGWRLDVAREVPIGFWNDWKNLVKKINFESIIIGELWEISSDFISANGAFDALMNYNFAYAVNDFFIAKKKRIKASAFVNRLKEIDNAYPPQNLHLLQNLIGSHDTERLSSLIANPDRKFETDNNERNSNYYAGKPSDEDYKLQKLVAAFQFTYKGSPMIYYGDEIGMWGADDPHDRKPMVWENLKYDDEVITELSGFKNGFGTYKVEQNSDLLNFYKQIISLRKTNKVFQYGGINFIYQNDWTDVFAFTRNYKDENALIIFNLSSEIQKFDLTLNTAKVKNLINNQETEISNSLMQVEIKPISFFIYSY